MQSNEARDNQADAQEVALDDSSNFFNRELSLLEFNRRVLALAQDDGIPLLERLRFLAICSSNLDEFFEVRVFGIKQRLAFDVDPLGADGLSRRDVFERLGSVAHDLVSDQYQTLKEIRAELVAAGIRLVSRKEWSKKVSEWVASYFEREVLPVLTPVGLDPAHPFPRVASKSLNFIVSLKGKDAFGRTSRAAVVQAPRLLPRLIQVPSEIAELPHEFVTLSSVMHEHVARLFPGMRITGCYSFRVTRNSDLWVDEEEIEDLLLALKDELPGRKFGGACRLEVGSDCPEEIQDYLLEQDNLTRQDLYCVDGPVNLHRLSALYDLVDRPDLKYRPFIPGSPEMERSEQSIFERIRARDLLLHHPFQSFATVLEFVREAARDPDVLAIKQTVYRTGVDSPLVNSLVEAAQAGKEVTAVVELRARFDEEANIDLATRLQQAGANVVYGVVGHKAHAKLLLIVRREGEKLRRYVHLGTGNYHTGTARAYTDWGLLTCSRKIGEDVHRVFQQLTGLGRAEGLEKLLQSPFTLHETLIDHIKKERRAAKAGKRARIVAKMNSLVEPKIIRALYRASQAGVRIDLIVRGICCLRPGVPGLSENIRVRSVLGRFLEHTRVFYFHDGGKKTAYMSSADWMPRNFSIASKCVFRWKIERCVTGSSKKGCFGTCATRAMPGYSSQTGLTSAFERAAASRRLLRNICCADSR